MYSDESPRASDRPSEGVASPGTGYRWRVAVVGAGIAGLTAARTLHDQGHDVHVFEKGRGVGGRTSVRRQAPFEFDHGAQYFTVHDECFARCVESWTGAGVVAPWPARIASLENGDWRPSPLQARYVGIPGMNALAKYLAAGLNVVTETRVARLTCDSGRWRLFGNDEAALGSFEVLVVAVPAAQAAELLAGQSALAEQAGRCALSPCWAVMLGFDRPLVAPYDAAFVQGSPLSWIARNSAKPRRSPAESWVLHGGPGWSAAHIDDPPLQVIAALTHEFQQLLRCGVSVPTHTAAHRWRYALPSEPLPAGPLWDAAT